MLVKGRLFVIDRGGFDVQLLGRDRRLNHRFNLRLIHVRLVDHVGDLRRLTGFPTEKVYFLKNPERYRRIPNWASRSEIDRALVEFFFSGVRS
jgi:hypothetical protein